MDKKEFQLKEICKFKNGYSFKNSDYVDDPDGYLVFKMGNIEKGGGIKFSDKDSFVSQEFVEKNDLHRFILEEGDLVMCMTDMKASMNLLGHVGKIDRDGFYIQNQRVGRIILKNEEVANNDYLYYYLNSDDYIAYLRGVAHSGVQVNLSTKEIKKSPIKLPSLEKQNKIASILSAFDDLIENNTPRIEILEEMALRIYREWFVHFRYPGHENDELVDSGTELGEIPEGWEVKKLEDIIDLQYGTGLRKKDRIEGKYPVYGSSGIIDWHNEYHVEGPGIIVGRKGNVGSMFWEYENFNPIDTTFYVETDLPLTYAFFNLQNQNFINSDAAVPGLSKRQASTLPVLVPDEETLENFDTKILQLFELKRVLSEKNEKLKETRDLLLPKLISGKIDVGEITIN